MWRGCARSLWSRAEPRILQVGSRGKMVGWEQTGEIGALNAGSAVGSSCSTWHPSIMRACL